MTASRLVTRRGAGLTGALALTVAVAAPLVLGASPRPAEAARLAAPTAAARTSSAGSHSIIGAARPGAAGASDPVTVSVDTLEPKAPRRGDTLVVTGTLTNVGDASLSALRVRLQVGPRLDSRSTLAQAARRPPAYQNSTEAQVQGGQLDAGRSQPFRYTVAVDALGLGRLGVYPLRVDVHDRAGRTVASLDTFLPWLPDPIAAPTRLAWVWPLVDQPHRAAGRGPLTDDDLARQLAPDGRLDRLVRAARAAATQGLPTPASATVAPGPPGGDRQSGPPGALPMGGTLPRSAPPATSARPAPPAPPPPAGAGPPGAVPVPVTWAIDPDLVDTAVAMAAPYEVQSAGGRRRAGAGTADALSWLAQLKAANAGAPTFALPYADPDVTALTRSGLEGDLTSAMTIGADTLARQLPAATALSGLAWPPDGLVTPAGLAALANGGSSAVVLAESALPLRRPLCCSTASAHATLSSEERNVNAIVADAALGQLVADGSSGGGTRIAEQRFLAETAMITAERNDSRAVVVAPPRRWSPDRGYADRVLADTGAVPWLRPISLTDVVSDPTSSGERASLVYPARAIADELSQPYLDAVTRVRAGARSLRTSLPNDDLVTPLQLGLLRSESVAWRGNLEGGSRVRDGVRGALAALDNRVRATSVGSVTLTSSRGNIPVTLANDLDQPVQVEVRVDAKNAARLRTGGGTTQSLAARSSKQIEVQAQSLTSGQYTVLVSLLTLDGRPLGPRAQLLVRSTAYGRLALGITGTALGVLLVAMGVRIVRRALRGRGGGGPTTEAVREDVHA